MVEVLVVAVAEDFVEEGDFKNLNPYPLNQKQLTFEKSYPYLTYICTICIQLNCLYLMKYQVMLRNKRNLDTSFLFIISRDFCQKTSNKKLLRSLL